jgi:hypothetical protein
MKISKLWDTKKVLDKINILDRKTLVILTYAMYVTAKENFGVTEEEFDRMITLAKKKSE